MKCSEITYKKVSELVLLPENPRTITKSDFARLVDSIKINGFWKHRPLAVTERDGKMVVLAGNQRLKAAKKLKLVDVPVIVYEELTQEEEKDIILRDNINNGDWDCNALQVDEFWKDVDFGFIGLDFPSDDGKSGKKKTAKETEETEVDQNEEEETDENTFAAYIRLHKKCPKCGSYMVEKGNKLVCSQETCGYVEAKDEKE